jgi:hypothetical protein
MLASRKAGTGQADAAKWPPVNRIPAAHRASLPQLGHHANRLRAQPGNWQELFVAFEKACCALGTMSFAQVVALQCPVDKIETRLESAGAFALVPE